MIGSQLSTGPTSDRLKGSVIGRIVGVTGLIHGAQGVTQAVPQAMAQVWNLARFRRPGLLPRLARSLGGLVVIGGAFLINAFVGSIAAPSRR